MQNQIKVNQATPWLRLARCLPACAVLTAAIAYLAVVLALAGGDPLEFARLGTRFEQQDPAGTEGYDGQFNYYIARNPDPSTVFPYLDVPSYRYQRILYPILARILSFGRPDLLAWILPSLNLLFLFLITWQTGELLEERGFNRWHAILIGLWPGLLASVRLDLSEPLALLLIILAVRVSGPDARMRAPLAAALIALSLFAKETMLAFLPGLLVWQLLSRRPIQAVWTAAALLPFAAFQGWLAVTFGAAGIGSGGAGSTPFEAIPFAGLFRIAGENIKAFGALALVYAPGLLLPALYGLLAPVRDLLQQRVRPEGFLLLGNALLIAFSPFSTFREPLGILRLACGLILSLWLYAARTQTGWWKKASLIGLAYIAFIFG